MLSRLLLLVDHDVGGRINKQIFSVGPISDELRVKIHKCTHAVCFPSLGRAISTGGGKEGGNDSERELVMINPCELGNNATVAHKCQGKNGGVGGGRGAPVDANAAVSHSLVQSSLIRAESGGKNDGGCPDNCMLFTAHQAFQL